jgi:hypothetical protein
MDEIVKAAMTKWPNVPHCYGWLTLDARGVWRMRDEQAQTLNLSGDPIRNATLLSFINRNYLCDSGGNWYFQNGPQKVYVDLLATPYIAQLLPDKSWRLHTGETMSQANQVWMLDDGNIVCKTANYLCQLDDRDLSLLIENCRENQQALSDTRLLELMELPAKEAAASKIQIYIQDQQLILEKSSLEALMREENYCSRPRSTT